MELKAMSSSQTRRVDLSIGFMPYTDPSLRRLKHGRIRPMDEDLTFWERILRKF